VQVRVLDKTEALGITTYRYAVCNRSAYAISVLWIQFFETKQSDIYHAWSMASAKGFTDTWYAVRAFQAREEP
jgi:hypothetical protein